MRVLMVALALSAMASVASAAGVGTAITGGGVTETLTPSVPGNARQQAEAAIKDDLRDPAGLVFHAVTAVAVASLRHGSFGELIQGPVSIVCGQYGSPDQPAGYAWFFVAMKRGKVLWTATDEASGGSTEAHDSCQAVGLVK